MIADGDIRGGLADDWLVVGWFTPSYRSLSEAFAAQLDQHGAPHHLFARPSLGEWNTTRKPAVVMEAMDAYPGKTIVLMDVDCIIRGEVEPVTQVAGDVGIVVIARNQKNGKRWRHWLALECSSRVVVFRPTDKARAFAQKWASHISDSAVCHDEHSMAWAFLSSPDVRFTYLDQAYSGREVSLLPDGIITHDSAHEKRKRGGFKQWLRAIEQPFRTGRTKADKLQGEMSSLLKA
jgi:hypothetical protein